MPKHSKRVTPNPTKQVTIISITLVLIVTALILLRFVPVATARTGECSARDVRLSILSGDLDRFNQKKQEADEHADKRKEEQERSGPVAIGCTIGETYTLYAF